MTSKQIMTKKKKEEMEGERGESKERKREREGRKKKEGRALANCQQWAEIKKENRSAGVMGN